MKKRILVTGASGFIGANLVRNLKERGAEVRVLIRHSADPRNLLPEGEVQRLSGNLRNPDSVNKAVAGCDEVFHVAADYRLWAADPNEIYETNVRGTENLLKACKMAGVKKIVYTSTVGTIGLKNQPQPCNELTPHDPGQFRGHYKKSKWEAEQIALKYAQEGLPLVIVNPSAPIGPMDHKPTPTGRIIVDFLRGNMPAYVNTGLNFIHVKDVVAGQIAAAEKGRVGERYILGNKNLTLIDFLKLISSLTGKPVPKLRIPYSIAWLAGCINTLYADYVTHQRPQIEMEAVEMSRYMMFFDSSKAIHELGLPQSPLEEAVEDAVRWYKDHGYFRS